MGFKAKANGTQNKKVYNKSISCQELRTGREVKSTKSILCHELRTTKEVKSFDFLVSSKKIARASSSGMIEIIGEGKKGKKPYCPWMLKQDYIMEY